MTLAKNWREVMVYTCWTQGHLNWHPTSKTLFWQYWNWRSKLIELQHQVVKYTLLLITSFSLSIYTLFIYLSILSDLSESLWFFVIIWRNCSGEFRRIIFIRIIDITFVFHHYEETEAWNLHIIQYGFIIHIRIIDITFVLQHYEEKQAWNLYIIQYVFIILIQIIDITFV